MSFACLAQAHRHRTLNYQVTEDIKRSPQAMHIPRIIREQGMYSKIRNEWLKDLYEVAQTDFPQAQLISVSERGILEDFSSKLILRLCGHAQHEIMERTLAIAQAYARNYNKFPKERLKPKCLEDIKCESGCVWKGDKALSRLV